MPAVAWTAPADTRCECFYMATGRGRLKCLSGLWSKIEVTQGRMPTFVGLDPNSLDPAPAAAFKNGTLRSGVLKGESDGL